MYSFLSTAPPFSFCLFSEDHANFKIAVRWINTYPLDPTLFFLIHCSCLCVIKFCALQIQSHPPFPSTQQSQHTTTIIEMRYGPLCIIQDDNITNTVKSKTSKSSSSSSVPPSSSDLFRPDGRKSIDEIRPLYLKGDVLSHAAGSSYIETGGTKVFASVFGPRPGTGSNTGILQCELKWAYNLHTVDEERELSRALTRALRPSLVLEQYPKSRFDVSVFILEDDGAAFATAITAACHALADACVHLKGLVVGACVAIKEKQHENETETDHNTNMVLMDPCGKEENMASCKSIVTIATLSQWNGNDVTNVYVTGETDLQSLQQATQLCFGSASQICSLLKSTLVKQVRKKQKQK